MHTKIRKVWINKPATKRLFIAIPIDVFWRRAFTSFQKEAKAKNITGDVMTRWTDRRNFHITVRFIGSINASCVPPLIQMLRECFAHVSAFEIPFDRYEIATADDPKMIWARFRTTDAFTMVVKKSTNMVADFLKTACHGAMLQNGHDIIPHVTLARLSGQSKVYGGIAHAGKEPGVLRVNAVVLHESRTLPEGSVYTQLAAFHLSASGR